MFEVQQAHYYSLDPALALSAVTTKAAAALGVDWRVGKLAEGGHRDTLHPQPTNLRPYRL
jgi:imidazolonepropionase-like amidohydrolase